MENISNTESDAEDLSRKTIEYLEKDGVAEANRTHQEKLRARLKESIDNLENLRGRRASGNLSDEDRKMYEFKIKVEKEEIARLKSMIKMNVSPEEWSDFKKLFPFAKQR